MTHDEPWRAEEGPSKPTSGACPHCGARLLRWRVPEEAAWGEELLPGLLQRRVRLLRTRVDVDAGAVQPARLVPLRVDPGTGAAVLVPVWSATARGSIDRCEDEADGGGSHEHALKRRDCGRRSCADAPRLGPDDTFTFACQPGVSCFNRCCRDVNIFLSPVRRAAHEAAAGHHLRGVPGPLRAAARAQGDEAAGGRAATWADDEGQPCPFVGEEGCSVYADRPWPCRMYPLGLAAQRIRPTAGSGERFYFLLQGGGLPRASSEPREWTVARLADDQGIGRYDELGRGLQGADPAPVLRGWRHAVAGEAPDVLHCVLRPGQFRQFVFESTLLERFEVDEDFVEEMRYDDDGAAAFRLPLAAFQPLRRADGQGAAEVLEAFKGSVDKRALFASEWRPGVGAGHEQRQRHGAVLVVGGGITGITAAIGGGGGRAATWCCSRTDAASSAAACAGHAPVLPQALPAQVRPGDQPPPPASTNPRSPGADAARSERRSSGPGACSRSPSRRSRGA